MRIDRCPVQLWTYSYWSPIYRNTVTLDCPARSAEQALESARRYLRRENRRLRRLAIPWFVPVPYLVAQLRLERPTS